MLLSIIIPTLNEEEYLPLLLAEIGKQRILNPLSFNIEIIVADAGSEDKTVQIAEKFGCKIVSGGIPARGRNQGGKIAKGELLLFLDADNIFLPENFLTNLLREFNKRNLGIASFTIYPKGNFIDKIIYGIYNNFVNLTQIPFAFNSVLVKKEIFEKSGGFDEEIKIGEDFDFAKKATKFGKFGYIKTEAVLTSARRFEHEGRIKTYFKYLGTAVYMLFFGPLKKDIFKYGFDFRKLEKNKKKLKIKK